MSDRELLELAAKAAGMGPVIGWEIGALVIGPRAHARFWNPLKDDGQAFRLMIMAKINIEFWEHHDSVSCSAPGSMGATTVSAIGDLELRRAIVRAAAEIGKALP